MTNPRVRRIDIPVVPLELLREYYAITRPKPKQKDTVRPRCRSHRSGSTTSGTALPRSYSPEA